MAQICQKLWPLINLMTFGIYGRSAEAKGSMRGKDIERESYHVFEWSNHLLGFLNHLDPLIQDSCSSSPITWLKIISLQIPIHVAHVYMNDKRPSSLQQCIIFKQHSICISTPDLQIELKINHTPFQTLYYMLHCSVSTHSC